jgi:hypothetical protein
MGSASKEIEFFADGLILAVCHFFSTKYRSAPFDCLN